MNLIVHAWKLNNKIILINIYHIKIDRQTTQKFSEKYHKNNEKITDSYLHPGWWTDIYKPLLALSFASSPWRIFRGEISYKFPRFFDSSVKESRRKISNLQPSDLKQRKIVLERWRFCHFGLGQFARFKWFAAAKIISRKKLKIFSFFIFQ